MASPFKNLYADQGFDLIALPKVGIKPLTLLCKEGDHLSSLESPLEALFEADTAPLPNDDTVVAPISGQKNLVFDLKSNLGFLSGIFQAMGLKDAELKAKAEAGHTYKVNFTFENVQEDKVGLLDLDNFLTGAIPLENEFRTYMKLLQRSELYVITSVLKSNSFSINVSDETGRQLDMKAGQDDIVSAKLEINRNQNQGFTITHKDGPHVAFAFKAVQILYNKAAWFEFWKSKDAKFTIKKQQGLVLKGEEDFPVISLIPGDQMVDI